MPAAQRRPARSPSADSDVVDTLHATLASLQRADDYEVLHIDRSADDDTVRLAYLELSRRYHPHRFARYRSAEASRLASEIFVRIQGAYGNLSGSQRVPGALEKAKPRTVRKRTDLVVSRAVELLQFHQHAPAIAALDEVLADDPDHEDARMWRLVATARQHKARGEVDQAAAVYRELLHEQPGHSEALSEAERLSHARKGSLLSRLFKLGG